MSGYSQADATACIRAVGPLRTGCCLSSYCATTNCPAWAAKFGPHECRLEPPPTAPPSPPPPMPPSPDAPVVFQCDNLCVGNPSYALDGDCDDGGPGSEYSGCTFGTDCDDCSPRVASPSPSPPPPVPSLPPPASPSPPTAPPLPPSLVKTSASDHAPCVVNTVTNCVCSSNIDVGECEASSAATVSGQYGSSESCQVDFTRDVTLAVHLLETEFSYSCAYDYVSVDDWPYKYCTGGDDGDDLDGKTTSTLQFDSDGSVQDYGFIICFS